MASRQSPPPAAAAPPVAAAATEETDTPSEEAEVINVEKQQLDIALFQRPLPEGDAAGLNLFGNNFNLVPSAVGRLKRLKTFEFIGNEIKVLPPEVGNMVDLERLQLSVPMPWLSEVGLGKMRLLRGLELCREPPRPSSLAMLSEITGLKYLTKLSITHFSIRYLPLGIGCLIKLEELDLSFNKLERLPVDIAKLSSLKLLRVSNNKLRSLPLDITSLSRLENLDVSYNKLISLANLHLDSMYALRYLNLQHNKLLCHCQIPPWICCNLEGTGVITNDEIPRPLVEIELYDVAASKVHGSRSCNGCSSTSCSHFENLLSCRQRTKKGWKRRDSLQQRARHERLNSSRMRRGEGHNDIITARMTEGIDYCESVVESENSDFQFDVVDEEKTSDTSAESRFQLEDTSGAGEEDACSGSGNGASSSHNCTGIEISHGSCLTSESASSNNCSRFEGVEKNPSTHSSNELSLRVENSAIESSKLVTKLKNQYGSLYLSDDYKDSASSSHNCTGTDISHGVCSSVTSESSSSNKDVEFEHDTSNLPYENSFPEASKFMNSKRHCDNNLDSNPKPTKCPRPVNEWSSLSCKYSNESFCSIDDHLPDGFYDAGRSRPFLSLQEYDRSLLFDSREVILLDREKDEELDAIALSAQILLSTMKRSCSNINEEVMDDNLQRASVLALYVSDCFGGSERSTSVCRMRRAIVGLRKQQPFICTCSGGSVYDNGKRYKQTYEVAGGPNFVDLCEESIRLIKGTLKSNVVPLGTLRFGVCRHRAVLMKYLCDRADPPIPCELVRGYYDFTPHAWNAIHVKRGNTRVRMIVDACYPTDMREETDAEFFCRYIPLCRLLVPLVIERYPLSESFTPPPLNYGSQKTLNSMVMHCKLGTLDAAMKLRTLDSYGASDEDIRTFEYTLLAEVRIMGVLRKHSHITEIYGHHFSSKWVPSSVGNTESRQLQSIVFMEYIRGGSLKCYLEKLRAGGEKHVPVDIALYIARGVASALVEVHSMHIIHRDIKSENILIDLDSLGNDGSPIVKLTDFDRSVPLQSFLHTCCIAHLGVHPPNMCIGTPRWMAPEVVQAMHQRIAYGLEVDIWSYGCLLSELLTLQYPYMPHSDAEVYYLLQMKQRPRLTPELEALSSETGVGTDIISVLVNLCYECTEGNPADRPTAKCIYDKLCAVSAQTESSQVSRSSE